MTEPNTETEQQPIPAPDYASGGIPHETRPMPMVNPVNAPDPDDAIFGSDQTGLREAAERRSGRRDPTKSELQAKTPLPVEYLDSQTGARRPAAETVSAEQSASDLTNFRNAVAAQELDAAEKAAIEQLDADAMLREVQAAVDRPQQPQPQPQPEQQPAEPQPALEGDDVWQNPKVIEGITQYTNQVGAAFQQAQQQYINELSATAGQATAAIFANYPELHGLQTADQLQGAIAAISRQNPERGQQIVNHIKNVQQLDAQLQQAQAQQVQEYQQAHRQQWEQVAARADDAFQTWADQNIGDGAAQKEVRNYALQMLRDEGLDDRSISHFWNSDPLLRSVVGQRILADAARYRMSRAGARTKVANPVPTVQRPGSPAARGNEQDYNMGKLSAELTRTGSAKAAAALLTARRGGRR